MKEILVLLLLSVTSSFALIIGNVIKVDGVVKVSKQDSLKKHKVKKGYKIESSDMISTYKGSHLVAVMEDNSTIIFDEESIISFVSSHELEQNRGRVYYKITPKKLDKRFSVKTDFAIIGIKGTTFIVDASKNKEVLLKEGLIGVSSIKELFEVYKKETNDAFENYKKQQEEGFKAYKKSFDGYKKVMEAEVFDLQQMNKISFEGNRVFEDPFEEDDTKKFQYFEQLSDSL